MEWFSQIKSLFTQQCLLCRLSSAGLLCQTCTADLSLLTLSPYGFNLLNAPAAKKLVAIDCQRLFCIADYQWPFNQWLTQLKFNRNQLPAHALADLFVQQYRDSELALPQLIVPVPLHRKRFRQRRFNQAGLLAGLVAKRLSLPCQHNLIERVKMTQAQTELSGAARRRNLRNAFELKTACPGSHIALFDDVITTGTTMAALCSMLRRHYPDLQIDVWSMAISLQR